MVERDAELGYLNDLLADSSCGRPRIVLVDGTVGSGKTALLRTFSELAIEARAVVLTAVSSRKESLVPMGVIGQLFREAQLGRPVSDPGQTTLSDVRVFGGATPMSVVDTICSLLEELAAVSPVVIAIDDVQYADEASLDCLQYLLHRLWRARVLFVMTESEYEQQPNPCLLVELLRLPEFRRLRLEPLSQEGVALMLTPDLGPDRACAASAAYHAITGGNPLLVRALLDDCSRSAPDAGEPAEAVVGDSYGQAVLVILHNSPESVLAVARALAVLGADSTPETVGQVLGMDTEAVVKAIERLVASGLVTPAFTASGENAPFRHDCARAAVYANLAPADRARLHGSVADLLHELGAPATAIAPHLLAGGQISRARASEILRIAAEQALHDEQPKLAIAYLHRAETATKDRDERLAVSVLLFQAEWQLDPARPTARFDPLLAAVRVGRLPWRDAVFLAKSLLWHGRFEDATDVLRFLGRESRNNQDANAGLTLLWDRLATSYPDVLDRAARRPAPAPIPTQRLSLHSQSMALLSAVLTSGGGNEIVENAEQLLRCTKVDHQMLESVEAALLTLIYANRPDRAAWWCDHLLRQTTDRQTPTWLATLSAIRAEAAIRQGDLPVAKKYGRAALTYLRPKSWGVALGAPVASLMLASTGMGMYSEAATLLSQPMPEDVFRTRYGLHYLFARGHHRFMTNRLRGAVNDFLACGELMTRWSIDRPALVPWRSAAANVLLRLGKFDQAQQLAEEQLDQPGANQYRYRGMSLRVLAKVSEPRLRPTLFQRAVTELRNSGDRLQLACALAELGLAHQELGDTHNARSFAAQALRLATECKAAPLRENVVESLGEGVRRHRWTGDVNQGDVESLSPAEFRVAALAAHGYTNRKIANQLRITASTVEQHLTRVYRKLKVTRRADLPVNLLTLTQDSTLAKLAL